MGTKFSTRVWVSVVGIASIFFGSKGYADTVISVADFGLKPDTRENAVAYVQKAIEACRGKEPVTLVFPEGRYDFWPQYAHEKNYYETNAFRGASQYHCRRERLAVRHARSNTTDNR